MRDFCLLATSFWRLLVGMNVAATSGLSALDTRPLSARSTRSMVTSPLFMRSNSSGASLLILIARSTCLLETFKASPAIADTRPISLLD